ncbi:MAG: DUF4190 domain-containing protein [Mycolicibacterium sp.]|jgi:hypothetical protein|nr:DUF4190 domain-containing protein [Mycolicibacterium sp.]
MTTPPYPGGDGFSVPGATPPVSSPQPIDYPGSYNGGYAAPAPYPAPSYAPPSYPAPSYPAPSYPGSYGAPAPYVDPYNPYGAPPSRGTNGMALASLICGVSGFATCGVSAVVGLILGIIGMNQIKRTGEDGNGMALTGIILGGLAVAGWIVYLIIFIAAVAAS